MNGLTIGGLGHVLWMLTMLRRRSLAQQLSTASCALVSEHGWTTDELNSPSVLATSWDAGTKERVCDHSASPRDVGLPPNTAQGQERDQIQTS